MSFRHTEPRRLIIGFAVGVAFASTFYFAGITVTGGTLTIIWNFPHAEVAGAEFAREYDLTPRPIPEIVGPVQAQTPAWAEPFWAGLSAAFGQAVALFFWFMRPQWPWSLRGKRAGLHARAGVATGLMWIGLVPLFLIKMWFLYVILIYSGRVRASAFGHPVAEDPLIPFLPYGLSAVLLVVLLALEPWRQLQLAYRCRWWPLLSVVLTLSLAAMLFLAGRALVVLGAL